MLFPDKLPTSGPGVDSLAFTVIVTVLVNMIVESRQDDDDTVLDGTMHMELFGLEYPGVIAKVDEPE